jgi:hypothetical protein
MRNNEQNLMNNENHNAERYHASNNYKRGKVNRIFQMFTGDLKFKTIPNLRICNQCNPR